MPVIQIDLPQVGESVTEAILEKWLKRVGDHVNKYEPLAEIVTDKVSMEMPCPINGVLIALLVDPGTTVPMGDPIAQFEITAEEQASNSPSTEMTNLTAPDRIGSMDLTVTNVGPTGSGGPLTTGTEPREAPRQRYSPAVLRLAQEHNLNLSAVAGTGISGRITRKDVQAQINENRSTKPVPHEPESSDEIVPLTAVRRMIADNMVRSTTQIPEAWMTQEVDVTNIMTLRDRYKDEFEQQNSVRLTPLAFALKAVSEALHTNPMVNSVWSDNGIILKKQINISIAVASPKGLLVPVIHGIDQLDIAGIAKAISSLVSKALHEQLGVADVQGGTFTVNNTGALGSTIGKGIINHPQAAILNTEAITKRPVVIGESIAIRSMMNICFTFDHRVIDGAEAGSFVGAVKQWLEAIDSNFRL